PLAHPAAPTPASAVLSGAIVKAGIFGLMQFLPFGIVLPGWHEALLAAGLATAWFGIAAGLTQGNAKTILAYSTISQMGIVAAVLAMALREGAAPEIALAGASLYALHHGFAKGALFMGVALAGSGVRMLAILALPALAIAGFPLTGGALAKLAIKPSLGAGMAELLVSLSAVGTSLLLLRFLCVLASRVDPDTDARSRPGVTFPWLFTIAAALVLPWALCATHSGQAVADALSPGNLWSALWPLVVAGLIAAIAWRARMRTPRVPPGDLLAAVSWMRRRFPSSPGPGRLRATLRASFER